jgi:predicted hydrocarbon binding protein
MLPFPKLSTHLWAGKMVSEQGFIEIMRKKGEARGVTLCTDAEYVRRHEGQEALRSIEEETKKMGYPIDYDKMKATDWYPVGLRVVSLLAAKKVLHWDDEEIKRMGKNAPKYSIITKLMLRYFASVETIRERVGMYWRRHYSVGSLQGKFIDDRSMILCLTDFDIHPILCTYLQGYFTCVLSMIVGESEELSMEETKCVHRGDESHEFLLKW